MENIFALDVGTRNVVGLLTDYKEDGEIEIKHARSYEHETRAMEDGQIHDIAKVAKTVQKIKEELELEANIEIKKVAVAVAGRALITAVGKSKKELELKEEIEENDVLAAELAAIQDSMQSLDSKFKEYHCVGYTVSEYKLDGNYIKNPTYQKGNVLEVELIATFLPRVVVDSMFTMANMVGLEISNLTLEPIAAISVVIPEDMRKLNLSLVDIGAGTSDIAITRDGKIIGYGMVPSAGDEITEKIAEDYILDFNSAEKLKRSLDEKKEKISITDVLGMEYEVDRTEIIEKIEEKVNNLALKICEKIIEINDKATQAVILIGGGSQIEGLKEKIQENLNLSKGRVAIRGPEVIKHFKDNTGIFTTSEFVTPVGISNMAVQGKGFKIISITINGESHRVFSFKNSITLLDALLSAGISSRELYSRPGSPLTLTINGKLKIIKGEMGKPSHIKVNGEQVSLESKVEEGADVTITKFRDGRDAILRKKSLYKYYSGIKVNLDGNEIEINPEIKINGETKPEDYLFLDRDEIHIDTKFYLSDLLKLIGESETEMVFFLNDKKIEMGITSYQIIKNDEILMHTDRLIDGDVLLKEKIEEPKIRIGDIIDIDSMSKSIKVIVNDIEVNMGKIKSKILKNGEEADVDMIINYNDKIEVLDIDSSLPIIADIFKTFEPDDLIKEKGGILQIEVNDERAEFITKLRNNDVIKMYYKKLF